MSSKEGAKRKAANNYPLEVIDLVDDSDIEDAGMHLSLVDKGREVINLVDNDDEAPVLLASKPPAKIRKTILPSWEVVLLVDDSEPNDFFNQLSQDGVRSERRKLTAYGFLWVARRCTTTTSASSKDQVEFVLGHACERKEINGLAQRLNLRTNRQGLYEMCTRN